MKAGVAGSSVRVTIPIARRPQDPLLPKPKEGATLWTPSTWPYILCLISTER